MIHTIQNSFNAGELSPYIASRPELEVYASGCKRMNNYISIPYGGARYRPGTEFIAETASEGATCLYGFEFSTQERNVLEFGEGRVTVHSTGLDRQGVVAEFDVPYLAEELRELQFAQLNDVIIVAHPNHHPRQILRFAQDDWQTEEFPFDAYPQLETNVEDGNGIEIFNGDGEYGVGSSVRLTSLNEVFQPGHIGSIFEFAQERSEEETSVELELSPSQANEQATVTVGRTLLLGDESRVINNAQISQPLRVEGVFLLQTFGTWTADIFVHRRRLGDDLWEDYLSFTGSDDRNLNEEFTLNDSYEIRVVVGGVENSISGRVIISVTDPFLRGRVRVTSSVEEDDSIVFGRVVTPVVGGFVTLWSEPAFSGHRGYPRGITFHNQRLWFGGTPSRPQTVWASEINGFGSFSAPFALDDSSDDDSPITLQVFADQQAQIRWLSSNRVLLAGTSTGEFTISGGQQEVITPGSFDIQRFTSNGSEPYQPIPMDQSVLFVQRQGRRLLKMSYAFENDSYGADDVTIYNEHLTRSGIVELAYQRQREPIVWGVTNDGKLAGWTYRPDQPFFAGYEITSPGVKFESVAVVYGDGDEDELWVVVNRDGKRYVERFRPDQVISQEQSLMNEFWFLDSAVRYEGEVDSFTGLDHLEGLEVTIYADETYVGEAIVENGRVANPRPDSKRSLVGIHYGGELETMPLELQGQDGTSQGRMKQAGRGSISLYRSLSGEYFTSQSSEARRIRGISPSLNIFQRRAVEDFVEVMTVAGGATRTLTMGVRQTHPYPMTILSVLNRFTVQENE